MTVNAIDLGYFYSMFMQLNGVTVDATAEDDYFVDWHTRVKTAMEAELGNVSGIAGDNWQVDRLFKWNNSTDKGYGFVIKRLDGTVSALETGDQWCYWMTGLEGLDNPSEASSIWGGTSPEFMKLFRVFDNVTSTTPPNVATMGVHYHRGGIGDVASQVLTLTGQPLDTETVVLDTKTYIFQTTLTDSDGNVKIGATFAESIDNLCRAINGGSGAGSRFAASMTTHTTSECTAFTGTTLTASARDNGTVGNAYATTETLTNGSWGSTVMTGGGSNIETYDVGAGADLDAPSTSPHLAHVDATGFLPDRSVRPYAHGMATGGIAFSAPSTTSFTGVVFVALWDWEVPFFGVARSTENYNAVENVILSGQVYSPRAITDRYQEGSIGLNSRVSGATGGGGVTDADSGNSNTGPHQPPEGTALDSAGAQLLLNTPLVHEQFSPTNQPRTDGTYDADPIQMLHASGSKGWIKREVMPEMGHATPAGSQLHATFEGPNGGYLKVEERVCIPWPVGTRATSVLTLSGGNVANGDQVEVAGKTYTFQTALTETDGNVLIGADEEDSLKNLFNAINLNPAATVRGVKYAAATTAQDDSTGVNAFVRTASTMSVRANRAGTAGNAITCTDPTDTGGFLSWSPATTLGGGVEGQPPPFLGYPLNSQSIPV